MYLCNLPSWMASFWKGGREQPRTWSPFKTSCLICLTRVTQTLVRMMGSVWMWKEKQAAGTTDLLPPCPGFLLLQVMQLKSIYSYRPQRSKPPGLQGIVETKYFTTVISSYQQPGGQVSLHKAKKPHSVMLPGCVNSLLRWECCNMRPCNGNCSSGIVNVRTLGRGHDKTPDPLNLCFVLPGAHQDKPSSSLVRNVSQGRSMGTSWECWLVELLEPLS